MARLSLVGPIYVTTLVANLAFVITYGMELTAFELTIARAVAPFLAGLLAVWFFYIRGSLCSDYRTTTSDRHIPTIWGRSLNRLRMVISLSHEKISLTQTELKETLQDKSTHLYALIAIGYKCIQTCNAIHMLCARGFPDQALSLCRGLLEQEANLRFILTVGNKEEVTERYLDWERAKTIIRWKDRNKGLVKGKRDVVSTEWEALTKAYERLEVKYHGNGNLKRHEEWAIGKRANCVKHTKAFSPEARAKQFIELLDLEKTLLGYTWTVRWQRLNEFAHTTPRSILESAASNDPKLVVTGPSHLGIDEPAIIAGQAMLNISTLLAQIATDEFSIRENLRIKDIGERALRAFYDMLEEVEKVPDSPSRWLKTVRLHHKQGSRSL